MGIPLESKLRRDLPRALASGPKAHLLLGTKYNIERHVGDWKNATGGRRDPPHPFGPETLVNYFVGSHLLTLKAPMVRLLRECYADPDTVAPTSFVLTPNRPRQGDERGEFLLEFQRGERLGRPNVWIVKSSHGCKGIGIRMFMDASEAIAFVDESAEPYPFIVQRYLDRPFLIGGRKFDLRVWAVLTPAFDIHVYREGVCRTASEPYSLDLSCTLAHLTNHCLQEQGPRFGMFEPGNEMWFHEFQRYLDVHHRGLNFHDEALPHINSIIRRTLLGVHPHLVVSQRHSQHSLGCFQIFGFDFMLDADFRVWLIEVNGSPALANHLLPGFVNDFVRLVIDPAFPTAGAADAAPGGGFNLIHSHDQK